MSHLEIDYESLISDLYKVIKNKRSHVFIKKWLYKRNITASVEDIIDIIQSLDPKLIIRRIFVSPGVTVREFDHSSIAIQNFSSKTIVISTKLKNINRVSVLKNINEFDKAINQM
jgi:hypothetical protein